MEHFIGIIGAGLGESWELVSYYIAMYADLVKVVVVTIATIILTWKGWEYHKKSKISSEKTES